MGTDMMVRLITRVAAVVMKEVRTQMKKYNITPINPRYLNMTQDEFMLMIDRIGHSLSTAKYLFDYTLTSGKGLTMKNDNKLRPVLIQGYYNSIGKELFEYGFAAVEESRNEHEQLPK